MGNNGDGELLTRKELADAFDVHPQTVTKWERDGLPIEKRGRPGIPSLYDREAVEAWLNARAEAAQHGGPVDVARERARKERAQARLAEQKYLERSGELVTAEEVVEVWGAHINAVRTKLLVLPTLPQFAIVANELEQKVREILTEIAHGSLEEDIETEKLCGAPTSAGTPCRNPAKPNGRCHIASHQAV